MTHDDPLATPPRPVDPATRPRLGRALRLAASAAILAVSVLAGAVVWQFYVLSPWTRDGQVRAQVANVALADARSITITPFEKSLVGPIEKAILASDLGLTPNTVGNVIRINLPPLTEERRKELSKHVSHEGENAKVAVRNVRRDVLHQIKELLKDKKVTEDEERRAEEDIQKYTDKFVKDIDGVVKAKEEELMSM